MYTNDNQNKPTVLKLKHAPIPNVKVGFIGLGKRGLATLERYMFIDYVQIVALCDLEKKNRTEAQNILKRYKHPEAIEYHSQEGWKKICEREDIDLMFICTDWMSHCLIATYAMKNKKHVAIEVPAATTVEECWELVNTAEETRMHCMMLENCCYDAFSLTALEMIKKGTIGEVVHAEGAYIHDLRELYFPFSKDSEVEENWILNYQKRHTGNPYPTHGLGPICQAFNIHRGDRLSHLVSMSSMQAGLSDYAERKYGKDSKLGKEQYNMGDVNTTLIQTVKGKSIMLQYSTSHPRPYSRIQLLTGTKGLIQKYPIHTILLDDISDSPLQGSTLDEVLERYKHRFTKVIGEEARQKGIKNEMNYIMDYRLIYCLRKGLPLDQDVYDAAEWSCLVELTEKSIKLGNKPVEIPDFTRGRWNELKKITFED